MRILLDTYILLWALDSPHRLPKDVKPLLEDPEQEILFSAASIWEIAIKCQIGRENFQVEPADIVAAAVNTGFVELPVRSAAACLVSTFPAYHKDPFDRLLIAQATLEPAKLITVDLQLGEYSELVQVF